MDWDDAPWKKDSMPVVGLDGLSSLTPEEAVVSCKAAIRNWTFRMLHGDKFVPGSVESRPVWQCHQDALQAWKDALEYWEAKLSETQKDPHDR